MSSVNSSNSDDHLIRRRPANTEPTGWYYEVEGRAVGPLSAAEMVQKIRAGEVSMDTQVRKDDSQWVLAGEVNGLMEAAARQGTHYKCPYCGARVDKPPTVCLECDREVTAVYRVREKQIAAPEPKPKEPPRAPLPPEPVHPALARDGRVVHAVITWLKSWWR